MAVTRDFIVKLIADPKELLKGFNEVRNKAGEAFGDANNQLQQLVPTFQKVTAASAVTFAGLTAAAGIAIKAAVDAQAEQNRLRQILLTTGGATDQQVKSLIAQAEALEKVGVASAGNIITAQSQLATFDLQFETIQRLTPAITDYVIAEKGATASAEDFKSMTNALAQALQGNFAALTKSGFVLDETTKSLIKNGTEAERSAALVDVLNSTYEGFNEQVRNTAEGQMVALRNSFNAIRQEIGTALLPAFEVLVGLLQKFADFVQDNAGLVTTLGIAIGVMTGTVVALSIAMKVLATFTALAAVKLTLFGVALSATGIGAIVVVIGLLIAGFVNLMLHSEKARIVVARGINVLIAGLEMLVNAVIGVINSFIDWGNVFNGVFRALGFNLGNIERIAPVSFGRVSTAASKAAEDVSSVNNELSRMLRLLPALGGANSGLVTVAQATAKVAEADKKVAELRAEALKGGTSIEALTKALKEQSDAQKVLKDLVGETEKKQKSKAQTTDNTKKAMEEYTKVLDQARSKSDAFGNSQKRASDAQKSLHQAQRDLLKAQEALNRAQEAGTPAEIADAQRGLAAAERGLTRSKFAQEESVFAVFDAERKLAEVRADAKSTAIDIRRAEIALEQAKLRVVDTEDDQIKSTQSLEKARRDLRIATEGLRAGDEELIPLKDAVTRAFEAQQEAAEKLADAIKDQRSALDDYLKSLKNLDVAQGKFPKTAGRAGREGLIEPFLPVSPGVPSPAQAGADAAFARQMTEINIYSTIADESLPEKLVSALRTYNRTIGPLEVQVI